MLTIGKRDKEKGKKDEGECDTIHGVSFFEGRTKTVPRTGVGMQVLNNWALKSKASA